MLVGHFKKQMIIVIDTLIDVKAFANLQWFGYNKFLPLFNSHTAPTSPGWNKDIINDYTPIDIMPLGHFYEDGTISNTQCIHYSPQEISKHINPFVSKIFKYKSQINKLFKKEFNFLDMYIYHWRPGSGIDWHDDPLSKNRIGAASYYLHDHWKPRWHGEFMYSKNILKDPEALSDGHFILPYPNRFIVQASGLLHAVNKTSNLSMKRVSLQIWFNKKGG